MQVSLAPSPNPRARVVTDNHYRGYDWKMGRDDCLYAMRRMYEKCSLPDKFKYAEYTYRCVKYKSGFANTNAVCDEGRC